VSAAALIILSFASAKLQISSPIELRRIASWALIWFVGKYTYRIIRGSFAPRRHDFLVHVSKIFLFIVCSFPTSSSEKKQTSGPTTPSSP
jgi:hypothetical protein